MQAKSVPLVGTALPGAAQGKLLVAPGGARAPSPSARVLAPSTECHPRRPTHPGSRSKPRRLASPSLLPAMTLVAASNTKGGSSPAGAARAMGLVPRRGWAPKVGSTDGGHPVMHIPIMSVLEGHHGVVGGHAQVTPVGDGHHAQPGVAGFLYGDVHRLGRCDYPQAPVRVHVGGGCRLANDVAGQAWD